MRMVYYRLGMAWHSVERLSRIFDDAWLAEAFDYKRVRIFIGGGFESVFVTRHDV